MGMAAKIDDNLAAFGNIHSQELADALRAGIETMYQMCPVGGVYPIMTNIAGAPDPNIWQRCDGSEITNPNSPLRSVGGSPRYTPNIADRFIKMTTVLGTVGSVGGASAYGPLSHWHDLSPVTANDMDVDGDKDGEPDTRETHNHTINGDWMGLYMPLIPVHYVVRFYVKIQ